MGVVVTDVGDGDSLFGQDHSQGRPGAGNDLVAHAPAPPVEVPGAVQPRELPRRPGPVCQQRGIHALWRGSPHLSRHAILPSLAPS